MTYLRNAWYVAAWADELERGKLLARTILGDPIVFFRDGESIHALHDRCPHRFAPLSLGTFDGKAIECGYHGLKFGGSGACLENPHGPLVKALCVRTYPAVEAHRALWIWMGNPDRAKPETIPDFSFLTSVPDSAFNKGYIHGAGNYQLYIDNLLDLSHTDYLHKSSLGGGSMTRTSPKVSERPDGVVAVGWYAKNEVPMPFMVQTYPGQLDRVDSYIEVEWTAPSLIMLANGFTPAGQPITQGLTNKATHFLTPETPNSTHYFFAGIRDYQVDDVDFNRMILEQRTHTFAAEDEPMIAAQQARMGEADLWSLRPVLLNIDKAGVLVRRRVESMIAAESDPSNQNRDAKVPATSDIS